MRGWCVRSSVFPLLILVLRILLLCRSCHAIIFIDGEIDRYVGGTRDRQWDNRAGYADELGYGCSGSYIAPCGRHPGRLSSWEPRTFEDQNVPYGGFPAEAAWPDVAYSAGILRMAVARAVQDPGAYADRTLFARSELGFIWQ